ncbi:ras-related protein Rab-24-like isoform X2 [Pomacea canaliculata]|uniref:ras-related protein Rab-24-like isoform X2 n=1 Tax=Pomacea canaliculata TaxID=400727 RepID=UPI000D7397FB|nr:ras-related protein Rab-24-like isoform X2 [Pomacea canaliculata]
MAGSKVDAKVVLLGKSYAGKTCLVERYLKNRFLGDTVPYQNTIGAAYGAKTVTINGKNIVIGIWNLAGGMCVQDTAGSERYEAMSRIYYRGARAAILCFDLTDKSSFDRVRFWIGELRQHESECKIYLCGTKYDLIAEDPEKRAVSVSDAKSLAVDCMADLFETSSKTGKDILEMFNKIAQNYVASKNLKEEKEDQSFVLKESGRRHHCLCTS